MDPSEVAQNAIDAAARGSFLALVALGVALLFGIMNLVNFAYGEVILAGGYAMLIFTTWFLDASVWPLLIIWTVVVAIVFALAQERLAFRPVRHADPTTMLVTSFAVSVLLVNIAIVVWSGLARPVEIGGVTLEQFTAGEIRIRKLDVITLGAAAFLLLSLTAFLKRTSLGIQMRAASEDFRMSQLLGVPANRVIATAFFIAGILAGSVALITVGNQGSSSPGMGLFPLIFGLVAVVLGGMTSLIGAVVGGFVLGGLIVGLEQGLATYGMERFRDAFVFLAVIVMLVFRPQGLVVGRAIRERV
ncbi:MAG: branched-chain amino acid ABC transporter permease [Actinomycetia bacterium]|nr:branched-chain amino acid ABC transporter permease [Actinomycetes bacterium]